MKSSKSAKAGPMMEEARKVKSKRTRPPREEKVPGVREFRKNLVGSKIMVWWPEDQTYYDGVIESFDPVKKKHRVLYTDGDVEILNLRNEKWMFIEDKSVPAWEQDKGCPCPDASSEISGRRKKIAKTISDLTHSAKSKIANNSRDNDTGAPNTRSKSSQNVTKSKGKTPKKSCGKSNASGSRKMKSGLPKVKQNEDSKVKTL